MGDFNTSDNLTHEAKNVLIRFIERELGEIDQEAVKALAGGDEYFENIEELTPRTLRCDTCNEEFPDDSDVDVEKDGETWSCETFDGAECPRCEDGDLEYSEDDEHGAFPVWGTMWKCTGWIERRIQGDVTIASSAGFRVYELEGELYLGVDGAGYDFYSSHWAPLYRNLFADSPVKDGDKLPGDPIPCPECSNLPVEHCSLASIQNFVCPRCKGEGTVPFETHEQKIERQRLEMLDFLCTVCNGNTEYETLRDEAQRILIITDG